jgi:hypothetical protein
MYCPGRNAVKTSPSSMSLKLKPWYPLAQRSDSGSVMDLLTQPKFVVPHRPHHPLVTDFLVTLLPVGEFTPSNFVSCREFRYSAPAACLTVH